MLNRLNPLNLLEEDNRTCRKNCDLKSQLNLLHEKLLRFLLAGLNSMVRRKPQRQQVRLLTTALRMEVRAFTSVGGGGRKRQNLEQS